MPRRSLSWIGPCLLVVVLAGSADSQVATSRNPSIVLESLAIHRSADCTPSNSRARAGSTTW